MKSIDLDVATPEAVPAVLREAAQQYHATVIDLSAAWGDKQAGKVWDDIAKVLERAADSIDRKIARKGV